MSRTTEPFWWSLFAAGGVIAALFTPVLILLTGLAGPMGWELIGDGLAFQNVKSLLASIPGHLLVMIAVPLPMFHCAHRVRHTAVDFGLHMPGALAVLCYGGATAASVVCGLLLTKI